ISPNTPDAMVKYVAECKALGIPYVYDPSQQIPLLSAADLRNGIDGAHTLIVNEYEIELIKERAGLTLEAIKGITGALVITRGENGSTIYADGEEIHIPPVPPARLADPTGAGDAYRAGLLAGRCNGLGWLEAGRVGALTAAYALEEHGTQQHCYTIAEFADRYFQHFERTRDMEAFFAVRERA
ncbi:MAG: PfkB family carbohydrate kinase, partial [Anaerolineae bacterium]